MVDFKENFFEYYENLKNNIDIHAEELILRKQFEICSINIYRKKFLDKIQSIIDVSLDKSLNTTGSELSFVYFIPRTNFLIDLKIFQSNIFGFLILVNQHIDLNVIQYLK